MAKRKKGENHAIAPSRSLTGNPVLQGKNELNPMSDSLRTRLFTPHAGETSLILTDADSLAVRGARRLKPGHRVACFNGDGREFVYTIDSCQRDSIVLTLVESDPNPCDEIPETTIFMAATKGKTKDRAIRDLTALGVTRIVFYRSERSICQPQNSMEPRFRKIAIESCRQCGRSTIPKIDALDRTLIDWFTSSEMPPWPTILFWEDAKESDTLSLANPHNPVTLIFGPEGGFTESEIKAARKHDAIVTTLGSRILRSELAVVTGTILVQARRNLFT